MPNVPASGTTSSPLRQSLQSADPFAPKVEQLKRLFPEAVSDGRIDWNKLSALLGQHAADGPERYGLSWAGKADALKTLRQLTTATLQPAPSESEKWDTTGNAIIEGDNLEVLKTLQHAYHGRVKMIYIDPPYNTGGEFIYPDDYSEGLASYQRFTRQVNDEGHQLTTKLDKSGRVHSRWLTMIYPRLFLARNLLRDDGVIFVSIDDNEVHNLRLVMDEIFGEENFVEMIIWRKRSTPPNDKIIGANHDYILIYCRDKDSLALNLRQRSEKQISRYQNIGNHPKGPWAPGDLMANVKGGRFVASLHFPIRNPNTGEEHFPGTRGNWRFNREKIQELLANDEIYFGDDGKGRPKLKRFLADVKEGVTYPTIWDFVPLNTAGSNEMDELFGDPTTFENPKPVGLVTELLRLGTRKDDLVLDFFGGSGTTAQAVLELNKEDGGNRKFILVQLPEPTGREDFATIAEITKERVRRVIRRMEQEEGGQLERLSASGSTDLGFKVFKLAPSNFSIWDPESAATEPEQLVVQWKDSANNVSADAEDDALLYELILKSGLALSSRVDVADAAGCTVYRLDEGRLLICLARVITRDALRAMIALEPQSILCLDVGFKGNDALKVNAQLECQSHGIQFRTA